MTQTTEIWNSGLLGHLSLCVVLKWSLQHGSFRGVRLLQNGLGLQKDGYQQNKRVTWELYHLLWLALKGIQCYFCCILLIRSNDDPCSKGGELDFIHWWKECQRMCGQVSRSPHTHGKTCYLSRLNTTDIFIMRPVDDIPIPPYFFLSQIDHLLHCTSHLPVPASIIICMLSFLYLY